MFETPLIHVESTNWEEDRKRDSTELFIETYPHMLWYYLWDFIYKNPFSTHRILLLFLHTFFIFNKI